jgi:putative membrane protein
MGDAAQGTTTQLAIERTRVAYDRTLMAWVRTATSLITFGFAVYKYFQLERPVGAPRTQLIGPREFALILIVIGLISLLVATWEHWENYAALKKLYSGIPRGVLTRMVAGLVAILGLLGLAAVILRE